MGPLHLNFGAKITELSIFQTICLLSTQEADGLKYAYGAPKKKILK